MKKKTIIYIKLVAAKMYNEAAKEHYGEFAHLNDV
jgi:hypothetical protein